MYNKQLDTFRKVAETGSFSRAAEALYITPSAVIQQINNLEKDLQVRLLTRTKKGTVLTPEGEYLNREAFLLIQTDQEIRKTLSAMQKESEKRLTVGTSLLNKCHLFYELWVRFCDGRDGYHVAMADMKGRAEDYRRVDLIEGICDGEPWQVGKNFQQLCTVPVACAVPKGHKLAFCKLLRYEDMRGSTLVTIHRGMSQELDRLFCDASERGIHVIEVARYDLSVFSMCMVNGYLLQTPFCWKDIHPDMITLPCEWEYTLPYGFFYKKTPSEPVKEFRDFVDTLNRTEHFQVY